MKKLLLTGLCGILLLASCTKDDDANVIDTENAAIKKEIKYVDGVVSEEVEFFYLDNGKIDKIVFQSADGGIATLEVAYENTKVKTITQYNEDPTQAAVFTVTYDDGVITLSQDDIYQSGFKFYHTANMIDQIVSGAPEFGYTNSMIQFIRNNEGNLESATFGNDTGATYNYSNYDTYAYKNRRWSVVNLGGLWRYIAILNLQVSTNNPTQVTSTSEVNPWEAQEYLEYDAFGNVIKSSTATNTTTNYVSYEYTE